MELQIQDLLSAIRNEGIEKANAEAEAIVAAAKQKAEAVLAEAKTEAEALRESAKAEAALFTENARLSAQQAKRDAVLAFKAEVLEEFKRLLSVGAGKSLNEKALSTLIAAALNEEDPAKYAVEVGEVSEALKGELAAQLKAGLEIRPVRSIHAGFRLAAKDGSYFFDCTDDEITKLLMPFFRNIEL